MSPTAFKQHVTQLVSDLKRCDELCDAILTHRRTGNKHESLDNLQLGFKAAAQSISIEYSALRKVFGSRFDLGDEIARHTIKAHIRAVELDIEHKLSDIANRRNDGLPGFRDMLRHVQRIEDSVADTLEALGQRLDRPEPKPEKKPEAKKPEIKKPKKTDEIVLNLKDWDRYTDHMKNSWMETLVAGKILYVNCFDEKKNTWDRPSKGFIQALPKPRAPVYDDLPPRRPTRDDMWNRGGGW